LQHKPQFEHIDFDELSQMQFVSPQQLLEIYKISEQEIAKLNNKQPYDKSKTFVVEYHLAVASYLTGFGLLPKYEKNTQSQHTR